MNAVELAESAKLRARIALANARYHADRMAAAHGWFAPLACEARMVERAARDTYVAALDVAIDLCRAGQAGP